jgi:hypothetical protein
MMAYHKMFEMGFEGWREIGNPGAMYFNGCHPHGNMMEQLSGIGSPNFPLVGVLSGLSNIMEQGPC